ncbi:hypothetical protein N473_21110 [Pseudoalteromonas luteoviolacea CPMOR-1]|uniref:Uncharacterized protein n=1 Tax=Pseudoalteromonas luteoviolacea CPMOR-1 TaxID=1365248 RepID=A0A167K2T6_9GAMM|nr:hypothetical protein N473_21110 [Pseudoalteromonas luteoviolacea CPMOR-1]
MGFFIIIIAISNLLSHLLTIFVYFFVFVNALFNWLVILFKFLYFQLYAYSFWSVPSKKIRINLNSGD